MALGFVYFAGLWLTVRNLCDANSPIISLFRSFIIRAAIAMTGFYLIMNGRWDHLISALIGFILIREVLVRRLGRHDPTGVAYGNRCH